LETEGEAKLLRVVRLGGYLILAGTFIGFSLGVYALFNPKLFSATISISIYEATSFFLSVCLPSLIFTAVVGYVFATMPRLRNVDLRRVTLLSVLSLLCLALSSLTLFGLISFPGGLLALTATLIAHMKPTFKFFTRREACFFVEMGALLVASFSVLFLLIRFISVLFPTYAMGLLPGLGYYDPVLVPTIVTIVAFLAFFMAPVLYSHGVDTRLCGELFLVISAALAVMGIMYKYAYFNASVYLGVLMEGVGILLILVGALVNIKLSMEKVSTRAFFLPPSSFRRGRYCPYCGILLTDDSSPTCSSCGRSLTWRRGAPFCPYCGRIVPGDARTCPHCNETPS